MVVSSGRAPAGIDEVHGIPVDSSAVYDKAYYESYGARDESGAHVVKPYRRGSNWDEFFAHIADCIVDRLRPRNVLDAGCAIGLLVEALRERGVDAQGFDVSEWAISQVPGELQPYCRVASLAEEIDGHFDLITCIEVIEHLPAHDAPVAVANICRHADMVLFSSSPEDFEEPTHLNVQPPDYWVSLFAERGFFRDVRHDASYVVPHAFLLRRQQWGLPELAERYDRAWWQLRQTLLGVQATRDQLAAELDRVRRALADAQPELEEALRARRQAEAALFEVQKRYDQLVDDLTTPAHDVAEAENGAWWLSQKTFVALQASRDRLARELDEAWRQISSVRSELLQSEDGRKQVEQHMSDLHSQLEDLQSQLRDRGTQLEQLEAQAGELERLKHTKLMRYTGSLRRVYGKLLRAGRG